MKDDLGPAPDFSIDDPFGEPPADRSEPLGWPAPDESGALRLFQIDPIGRRNIPPRRWAYGKFLQFGQAAVLGAIDGGGKGAQATVIALSMITGKDLLGEKVWQRGPVVIITYEDNAEEWHRRIAAACEHYGLDYKEVLRHIHFIERPKGRITFATMSRDGKIAGDADEIIRVIRSVGAGLLIIDPMNQAHDLADGNNNVQIAKAAAEISRVAEETGAAVLVLHHLRKGATGAADDLMGATSLRATFRSCRILSGMTPEAGEKMNITDPWRYSRIAGTKQNYAPPPDKGSWFRLVGVDLENYSDLYPAGDDVGVTTSWVPRAMFEGMDASTLRAVFSALRASAHSPNKQSRNTPWAGVPLKEIGQRNDAEATGIVKVWIENGVLNVTEYLEPKGHHIVKRVTLDDEQAAGILAEIRAIEQPDD